MAPARQVLPSSQSDVVGADLDRTTAAVEVARREA